jgi:hypothetical protein
MQVDTVLKLVWQIQMVSVMLDSSVLKRQLSLILQTQQLVIFAQQEDFVQEVPKILEIVLLVLLILTLVQKLHQNAPTVQKATIVVVRITQLQLENAQLDTIARLLTELDQVYQLSILLKLELTLSKEQQLKLIVQKENTIL